jgi:Flp pilus assembly protein TadB
MSAAAGLAAAAAGAAATLLCWHPGRAAARRVSGLRRVGAPSSAGAGGWALRWQRRPARPTAWRPAAVVLAVAGSLLAVPGLAGVVLAIAVAAGSMRLFRWGARSDAERDRDRLQQELPFALDLIAASLTCGAGIEAALDLVGAAIAGPLGAQLTTVAAALALGQSPSRAWALADATAPLAEVGRALARASVTGAAPAEAVRRAGAAQRAVTRTRADAAARRASVFAVLPLGLCFLPAFVLLAVVPLVAGVAAQVGTGR